MLKRRFHAAALAVAALFGACGAAWGGCGGKLGTERTVSVSPHDVQAVHGAERALGLRDGEVVLTFDDGPLLNTAKVLRALEDECVRATFFVVGKHVARAPAKVRAMMAQGHTIAHHTWGHERLPALSDANMERAVDRGVRAVNRALYGTNTARARIPYFRYPYLAKSKRTGALLRRKGLVEIGTNIDTGDWRRQSPAQLHDRIMRQLRAKRRGIVLMHDIQPRTASMLPRLLRSMKREGFRVVHLVPADPAPVAMAALRTQIDLPAAIAPTPRPQRSVRTAKVEAELAARAKLERASRAEKPDRPEKPRKAKERRAKGASAPAKTVRKRARKRSVAKRQTVQRRTAKRRTAKRRTANRTRRVARKALRGRFIIQ